MLIKSITEITDIEKEVKIFDWDGKAYVAPLLPKDTPGTLLPAGVFAVETMPGYAYGYHKDNEGRCRVLPLQSVSI